MKILFYPKTKSKRFSNSTWFCFILLMGLAQLQYAQSYTFTPCGASGANGPNQTMVTNTYSNTNLSSQVTTTGGIQYWTVPATGLYALEARGAQGANSGGFGAYIRGEFSLTAGQVLKILVGQAGVVIGSTSAGGGGGSFISSTINVPLLAAGGGGGRAQSSMTSTQGMDASITTTANNGYSALNGQGAPYTTYIGYGGTGGSGASGTSPHGGNGGGFFTNGGTSTCGGYGSAFVNGGTGGAGCVSGADGGFGGGAGGGNSGGGGGGGYSGGGGSWHNPTNGGGGASYNSGANQTNSITTTTGAGVVIVTKLTGVNIAQTSSLTCNGQSSAVLVASFNGGTSPYSYTWAPGGSNSQTLSGLSAGTYTCYATDASAVTYSAAFTVTQPSALTSTITGVTNVSCSGAGNGQVSISASGGVPAYTYTWLPSGGNSTTASGLSGATYTCLIKDANNCISQKTVAVSEPAPTSILGFATSPTVCYGQTSILIGAGALTYTWTGGATNGVAFVPAATTVYTVTGTNSSGCNGTATVLITVNPLPALAITGQSIICNGSSSTLNVTGANSYTWSTSSNNSSITVSPTSNTSYTVSGTNGFNCVNSSVITVTVLNVSPVVTASASSPTICLGGSTTLYGGGATTYSWSGGVTDGVPFSPGISGIYTVTGYNACGNGSTTIVITVNALPNITANASSTAVCIGSTALLTGGGGVSYVWTGGVTNANTFFPSVTSTYTVTGTDINGCQNTATKTIVVNPLPAITANITNSVVCLGNTTTLFGGGGVSYSWSGGVTNGSPFAPSATSNYTVTGTDANGCQNTASKTVSVINVPAMSVAVTNSAICLGGSTTFSASGALTYTWTSGVLNGVPFQPGATNTYSVFGTNTCGTTTLAVTVTVYPLPVVTANASNSVACFGTPFTLFGGGASTYTWSGGITNNVAFLPSVSGTYTVTGTDTHGCQNTATKSLTVNSLPVVTASATSTAFCRGGSTTLSGGGALTYTWSNGVTNNTSFTPTVTATYTVTGTDANGCQNTAFKTVTVYQLPVVGANVSNPVICQSNGTSFFGTGANTYTWSGGITNAAIIFPSVTTTYSVTGTNTLTGCVSTNVAYATVTVNPLPSLTITASAISVCQGQSVILTASGASSYTWSPVITNGVSFTPNTTTNYYVTGRNNSTGCSNIAMQTISVNPIPGVWGMVSNQSVCFGTPVTFNGGGADTYTWTGGVVNGVPYTPTVSLTYSVSGTNTVTGCTSTNVAIVSVIVNTLPTLIPSSTQTAVCVGGTVILNCTGGATSYSWSGGVTSGVPFTPTSTTTYSVFGVNAANGCTNVATRTIVVNPLPAITVVASATAICQGGTLTLNGAGANTYTWTGGVVNGAVISPNATNSYTVSGTNTLTGCRSLNAAQQTIVVNSIPVVSSSVTANTICSGQSVVFSGFGADTYTWTNGPVDGVPFTPTQTAVYSLSGTNLLTGCTSTNNVVQSVIVNFGPLFSVSTTDTLLCAGESCTLSCGSTPTRTWSTGEVGASIVVTPSITTSYTVYAIGANTCSSSATFTQNVIDCTGLNEHLSANEGLLIYPNPSNGNFIIKGQGELKLSIINEIGQIVRTISIGKEELNVQNLAPGIYFVTGVQSGHFIKQKVVITE